MSQMGKAGEAIGISTISSTLGGFFSVIVLMFAAPAIASVALKFSAEEYVGITLIGLSIIAISAGTTVRFDRRVIGNVHRYCQAWIPSRIPANHGQAELWGHRLISVMIGMYGLSEMS
jgi:putative tricarboxylic transport membrane protein